MFCERFASLTEILCGFYSAPLYVRVRPRVGSSYRLVVHSITVLAVWRTLIVSHDWVVSMTSSE